MSRLGQDEKACYDEMWQVQSYHDFSPGKEFLPVFLDHATPGQTVLDAGCGAGAGSLALQAAGFKVTGFDISSAGLTEEFHSSGIPFKQGSLWGSIPFGAKMFDWAYCCDVMEHIPPQFTMLVASNLLTVAHRVFFSISLQPDQFGVWVGRSLHLSVYSFKEWRDMLAEIGDVVEARDLHAVGLYVIKPKPFVLGA